MERLASSLTWRVMTSWRWMWKPIVRRERWSWSWNFRLPLQPLGDVQGCSRRRKMVPLQVLWLVFSSVDHNFKPVEMDAILVEFTLHHFKNVSLSLGPEQCVSLFYFFLLQRENAVWGVNDFMTMQPAMVDHRDHSAEIQLFPLRWKPILGRRTSVLQGCLI